MFLLGIGILFIIAGLTGIYFASQMKPELLITSADREADDTEQNPYRGGIKLGGFIKENWARKVLTYAGILFIMVGIGCIYKSSLLHVPKDHFAVYTSDEIQSPGWHWKSLTKDYTIIKGGRKEKEFSFNLDSKDHKIIKVEGYIYYNYDPKCFTKKDGLIHNLHNDILIIFAKHLAKYDGCTAIMGDTFSNILSDVRKEFKKDMSECYDINVDIFNWQFAVNTECMNPSAKQRKIELDLCLGKLSVWEHAYGKSRKQKEK